jgi:hypothetical protein
LLDALDITSYNGNILGDVLIPVCLQIHELGKLIDVISNLTVTVSSALCSFLTLNHLFLDLSNKELYLSLFFQELLHTFILICDCLASLLKPFSNNLTLTTYEKLAWV